MKSPRKQSKNIKTWKRGEERKKRKKKRKEQNRREGMDGWMHQRAGPGESVSEEQAFMKKMTEKIRKGSHQPSNSRQFPETKGQEFLD